VPPRVADVLRAAGVARTRAERFSRLDRSTIEPFTGRRYVGGASLANAFFTVFFEIPKCRAIARIGIGPAQPADLRPVLHPQHLMIVRGGSAFTRGGFK
jgi:hypothetical protein